ncbi:MAG TPA: O-antigen ligase family protein [Chloroflexia bacterium]|nr:O-antigen ligase family protein [Chloroflexia bacterium]
MDFLLKIFYNTEMEILITLKMLRRYCLLIGFFALVGISFGLYFYLHQEKVYEARLVVRVNFTSISDSELFPDFDSRKAFFNSVLNIASSDTSLQTLAQQNNMDSTNLRVLRQAIKITAVGDSEFLQISVTTPDNTQSIKVAQSGAYLIRATSAKLRLEKLNDLTGYYQGQIKLAQDEYNRATASTDRLAAQYSDAVAKREQKLTNRYDQQLDDATTRFNEARKNFEKALTAVPSNSTALELAKTELLSAQDHLASLQTANSSYEQLPPADEVSLASTLTTALEFRSSTRIKVTSLQAEIERLKSFQQLPGLQPPPQSTVDDVTSVESGGSLLWVLLGLSLGMGAGTGLALLLNYFARDIDFFKQLTGESHQPQISYISVQLNRKQRNRHGLADSEGYSKEAIRALASRLIVEYHRQANEYTSAVSLSSVNSETTNSLAVGAVALQSKPAKPLYSLRFMLTTLQDAEAKSAFAGELALVLAEAGYQTLLVDCTGSQPEARYKFPYKPDENAASGKIYHTDLPELDVLYFNPLAARLSGADLPVDQIEELDRLAGEYQFVLGDAPALDKTGQAEVSAIYFSRVMFLTGTRKAEIRSGARALPALLEKQATLDWVVVDRPKAQSAKTNVLKRASNQNWLLNIGRVVLVVLLGLGLAVAVNRAEDVKTAIQIVVLILAVPLGLLLVFRPRLALWTLVIYANFLFFLNRFVPQIPMGLGLEALILAAAGGTLLKTSLRRRWPKSNLPRLLVVGLVIYSLYYGFQIFNPNSPGIMNGLYGFRWWLLPVLLPWLTSVWLGNGRDIRRFFVTWLVLSTIVMLYGIWQQGVPGGTYRFTTGEWDWLEVNPTHVLGDTIRIFSTLGSADAMGLYMVIVVIISLGLLPSRFIPMPLKPVLLALIPLAIIVMLWTLTRSAYAGLPVGLMIITVLTRNRWLVIFSTTLLAVYLFLFVTGLGQNNVYIARFFTLTQIQQDDSYQVRQEIQDRVINKVFENPIGSGPSTTGDQGEKTLVSAGGDLADSELAGTATDNYYLRIGLENGWLGVISFLVLAACALVSGLKCFFKAKSPTARFMLAVFLAITGAMLLASWANNYFQYPPLTQLFFMSLGLLGPLAAVKEEELNRGNKLPVKEPWEK